MATKILRPYPIELPVSGLDWWDLRRVFFDVGKLHADVTAKDLWPRAVRISFGKVLSTRIVDEVCYSCWDGEHQVLNRPSCLYTIEGDEFCEQIAQGHWMQFDQPLAQYAILGLNDCLEVITTDKPVTSFIELEA